MSVLALRNLAMQVAGAAASFFAVVPPASAFTVSDIPAAASARLPAVAVYRDGADQPKLEQVWCRWGCGAPAFIGGLAAGAIIGGALAGPRYYGGPYYGGPYYGAYYGGPAAPGCWRSVWTDYGWRRVWVC